MWPTTSTNPSAQIPQSAPAAATVVPSGNDASTSGAPSGGGSTGGYYPAQQPATPQQFQGAPQQQPGGYAPAGPPSGYQPGASLRDNMNAAVAAGGAQAPIQPQVAGQVPGQMPGQGAPQQSPVSVEQLQRQMAEMQQQLQTANQWSAYGQHQWYQQQLQRQQGQAPGQSQPAAAPQQKSIFGIPQFDKNMLKFAEIDPATGRPKFGPGVPPTAQYEYAMWEDARRNALDGFLEDPMKYLWPAFEEKLKGVVPQMTQEQLVQRQAQQEVSSFVNENADWLYQADPSGRIAQHPITGQRILSQAGQMFQQQVQYLDSIGVKDHRAQEQLAKQHVWVQVQLAQQRQQAAATAAAQSAQGRQNLLGGGQAPSGALAVPVTQPSPWGGMQQPPMQQPQAFTPPSGALPQQPMFPTGINHRSNLRGQMMNLASANGLIQQPMPGGL